MDKLITLEDLTKAVQNNYSRLIKEGQVKSILRNIGVFVDQTVDNSILILLQNPDATCVKRLFLITFIQIILDLKKKMGKFTLTEQKN